MAPEHKARIVLRVGLAFAFLYAATSAFRDPQAWIGFFPPFLRTAIPQDLLLRGFELSHVVLALWLLSGKKGASAALVSSCAFAGIVIFNVSQLDILFRDISLFSAAVALYYLNSRRFSP